MALDDSTREYGGSPLMRQHKKGFGKMEHVCKRILREFVAHSPWLRAAWLVMTDVRQGYRMRAGNIETDSGATHAEFSLNQSLDYIEGVFADYKRYGGLDRFHGSVAEIGPGDNAGVALLMRRDGCQRVDLVDRYFSRRDPEKQRLIYEALSTRHQLDALKSEAFWSDQALIGVSAKVGHAAELFFETLARSGEGAYDFIVSRAVMEHLYDPLGTLESMTLCLEPGGQMIHLVDLRDHGLFSPALHELTFLRFPRSFYRLMTHHSGRPNRILLHDYRKTLDRLREKYPITYRVYITHLVGVGELKPHLDSADILPATWRKAEEAVDKCRSQISREFREVSSRDLAVAGLFIVVQAGDRTDRSQPCSAYVPDVDAARATERNGVCAASTVN